MEDGVDEERNLFDSGKRINFRMQPVGMQT
jgi:hypothetical protein